MLRKEKEMGMRAYMYMVIYVIKFYITYVVMAVMKIGKIK